MHLENYSISSKIISIFLIGYLLGYLEQSMNHHSFRIGVFNWGILMALLSCPIGFFFYHWSKEENVTAKQVLDIPPFRDKSKRY